MFLAAKEFPLPIEYRFLPLEEVFHEPPADVVDRTRGLPRLRQHRPDAGRLPAARRRPRRSTSTTTTTTPASATVNLVDVEASCTAEIVYELAKLLGVEITPEIAARALRRRWSPTPGKFMYENTDAAHAPDRGRADRGRGRRRRHLPAPLRARPDREAAAGRARAREDRAPSTTARSSITYITAADYEATGRRRGADRGDHRLPARARGRRGRGADPRQGRRRPRRAQGQPALDRRRGRRLGDRPRARAAAGTGAPPASRTDLAATTSWSSSSAPRSPPSSALSVPRREPAARSCSSTSRPGSPRTTWSPGCGASAAPRPATPAPSTRSRPAC